VVTEITIISTGIPASAPDFALWKYFVYTQQWHYSLKKLYTYGQNKWNYRHRVMELTFCKAAYIPALHPMLPA
jgi:hypothetical protein